MTLPADLSGMVASLEAVDRSIAELAAPLSEAQFNWQPHEGRAWSVGQCVEHLRVSAAEYLPPLEAAAEDARTRGLLRRQPLRPGGWPSRWFVSMMGPQPRLRMKAPSKIAPASTLERASTLAAFHAVTMRVRDYVIRNADLDLNAVRFVNPLVRGIRFTAATGLLVLEAHNRRHLWQAQQVVRLADFPLA